MIWWRADDCITCDACHGRCHDAVEKRGKATLLECNYCGLRQLAYNAPEPPMDMTARMNNGRFAGMTIYEIDKQKNGRRYLEHIVKTKGELCEVVSKYLAASQ